jgi:hypothetical protein
MTNPFITPEMARARAKREILQIVKNVGRDLRTDEFLDETLCKLEAEELVLKAWRYLHRITCGGVRQRDVSVVCDAVRWRKVTLRQAALERFPQLSDEIEGDEA